MTVSTVNTSHSLAVGPAGRAMAQPMEDSLVEALQQHLTMERQASAMYFAFAIWFSERELGGFSNFFKNESTSEQQHASGFADYLIARGQTVLLESIDAPRQNWNSPEEIMEASFLMESEVTTSLQQLYATAERVSDVRTTVFLDPLVENQVTSENEFAYLVGRVRYSQNQAAAMLIIDNELREGQHSPPKLV